MKQPTAEVAQNKQLNITESLAGTVALNCTNVTEVILYW
jgi:hypothetical protein